MFRMSCKKRLADLASTVAVYLLLPQSLGSPFFKQRQDSHTDNMTVCVSCPIYKEVMVPLLHVSSIPLIDTATAPFWYDLGGSEKDQVLETVFPCLPEPRQAFDSGIWDITQQEMAVDTERRHHKVPLSCIPCS